MQQKSQESFLVFLFALVLFLLLFLLDLRMFLDEIGAFPDAWICDDINKQTDRGLYNYKKIVCEHMTNREGRRGHEDLYSTWGRHKKRTLSAIVVDTHSRKQEGSDGVTVWKYFTLKTIKVRYNAKSARQQTLNKHEIL